MRLVTRSDFDGLICAVLLKQVEKIESIEFVHPKDIQDGKLAITPNDILANVPYVPGCGLWFDHHSSEFDRVVGTTAFKGSCRHAPSAARLVYDYYGSANRFPGIEGMMIGVDKADSARFTLEEITDPAGWDLLSFIMDARTGLGRFRDYRISNYELMYSLIDACTRLSINEILNLPDVQQRVKRYFEQDVLFRKMLYQRSRIQGDLVVTDLRGQDPIYCGNRFMVYALHPKQNCSIWAVSGRDNKNVSFACGHSILNRTCAIDIGSLMRYFGGGGHRVAGTCQVPHDQSDHTLATLVGTMSGPAVIGRAA